MKPTINSRKHIVQASLTTVQELARGNELIINAVADQPDAPAEVVVGATVKAVYLEFWLLGESGEPCTATWIVEKVQNNQASATYAQMQALDTYENKRNIFQMGQGVIGDSGSNPVPVVRGWVKIPKGKQRFALGDSIKISFACVGVADNGLEYCGTAIFKEYY